MRKNQNTPFDIFVKKIWGLWETLVKKSLLEKLWLRSGGSKSRFSYALGKITGQEKVSRITKDIFFVGESAPEIHEIYWQVVSLCIDIYAPSGGYIGGEKALEIHLQNYSLPKRLIIYTRDTNARISIFGEYQIHFRTLATGEKSSRKNIFNTLYNISKPQKILSDVYVPSKEIALLEALSLRKQGSGIYDTIILQFLERYDQNIDRGVFEKIIPLRYIRAINRLREFARDFGYDALYQMTLEIIRKYGGNCFIKGK